MKSLLVLFCLAGVVHAADDYPPSFKIPAPVNAEGKTLYRIQGQAHKTSCVLLDKSVWASSPADALAQASKLFAVPGTVIGAHGGAYEVRFLDVEEATLWGVGKENRQDSDAYDYPFSKQDWKRFAKRDWVLDYRDKEDIKPGDKYVGQKGYVWRDRLYHSKKAAKPVLWTLTSDRDESLSSIPSDSPTSWVARRDDPRLGLTIVEFSGPNARSLAERFVERENGAK